MTQNAAALAADAGGIPLANYRLKGGLLLPPGLASAPQGNASAATVGQAFASMFATQSFKITHAELLEVNTDPVTLLAAPGADNYWLPLWAVASLNDTTSYAGESAPGLYYGTSGGAKAMSFATTIVTHGDTTLGVLNGAAAVATSGILNEPLVFTDSANWTTGNGDLFLTVGYLQLSLPASW
jgi:hypothetical protein